MICVVKDVAGGRMLPACSAKAVDGMEIDADSDEVRAARREILQMILSEHVGDCEAPCSRICPASLDIPRMLRRIAEGDLDAAARIAKRDLVFPATLGYLCTAPCERGCRRAAFDRPLAIRGSHREAAEWFLKHGAPFDECAPTTGKAIAIVGASLAGLTAAWMSLHHGHVCCVYEKEAVACASLRSLPPEQLPPDVLDAEIQSIAGFGVDFAFQCEVGVDLPLDVIVEEFDAVILACEIPGTPYLISGSSPSPSSSEQIKYGVPGISKVFVAREDAMPVRSVASGKSAARHADAFLRGRTNGAKKKPFNSRIGELRPEEKTSYAAERFQQTEEGAPGHEASRCLHCDCLKPVSCKLRRYADEYRVGPNIRRHMERPSAEPIQTSGEILFETGKCIKCGICVEIVRAAGNGFGLMFTGRGLASRVRTPFGEPLARGLGEVGLQCVRACPTGALALRHEEEEA